MPELPLIVDERPRGAGPRLQAFLRGRRFFLSACLALAEVVAFVALRPGTFLAVLAAALVLGLSVSAALRIGPGPARDVLWIVALAQSYVVVVPVVIGFSLAIGMVVAVLLIAGLAVAAFRYRF